MRRRPNRLRDETAALEHQEQLLVEAGFESVRWLQDYDLGNARAIGDGERPLGPYQLIAER